MPQTFSAALAGLGFLPRKELGRKVTPAAAGAVGVRVAQQGHCHSCNAWRVSQAVLPPKLPVLKSPYSLCLNQNSHWIWSPKPKVTWPWSMGEPPFFSTDQSGKAEGFPGMTVSDWILWILWCSVRDLRAAHSESAPVARGAEQATLETEQAGERGETKRLRSSESQSPVWDGVSLCEELFHSQSWTTAKEMETAPKGNALSRSKLIKTEWLGIHNTNNCKILECCCPLTPVSCFSSLQGTV